MIRVVRRFIASRRIRKLLRSCGVPTGLDRIFSGDVRVETMAYEARRFADFFVEHHKDPS